MTIKLQDRIRRWRAWSGKTQQDVADSVGISRAGYSQWETGVSSPSTTNLAAFCSAIGVNLSRFWSAPPKARGRR